MSLTKVGCQMQLAWPVILHPSWPNTNSIIDTNLATCCYITIQESSRGNFLNAVPVQFAMSICQLHVSHFLALMSFLQSTSSSHFESTSLDTRASATFSQVQSEVSPSYHLTNTRVKHFFCHSGWPAWLACMASKVPCLTPTNLPNGSHLAGISAPTYSHKSRTLGSPNLQKSADQ